MNQPNERENGAATRGSLAGNEPFQPSTRSEGLADITFARAELIRNRIEIA